MKRTLLISLGLSLTIPPVAMAQADADTAPPTQMTAPGTQTYSSTTTTTTTEEREYPLYRDFEFSIDAFGTLALDQWTLEHATGERVKSDARLGVGLGGNIFFNKYVGIGGEAYSENPAHSFVDNADGFLIIRIPILDTGIAPYIFGGGGHKFDPDVENFGDAGAGIEFRLDRFVGIFVDARAVWTTDTGNYGLGRAGLRLVF